VTEEEIERERIKAIAEEWEQRLGVEEEAVERARARRDRSAQESG
jgi:hypothetical protein